MRRRGAKKLPDDQMQTILRMLSENKPYHEIAEHVDISGATISNWVRRGLLPPKKQEPRVSDEQARVASEMFAGGKNYQAVADYLGMSTASVWYWVQRGLISGPDPKRPKKTKPMPSSVITINGRKYGPHNLPM